jgi:phosphate transport system substrate-binding protein
MRKSKIINYIFGFIAALVISNVFFTKIAVAADHTLIWMGCGISKKAYMGEMAKVYSAKTGIKFRMSGGGATKGIRLAATGKADIGGSCRFVLLKPSGSPVAEEDVNMIHVAWDALAVVVNKNNPVRNITRPQLQDVFLGKIKNWQELGGDNQPIRLLVRKGTLSGVGRLFRQLVLNDEDYNYSATSAFFSSSGPLEKNLDERKSLKYGIAITGISSAKKTKLKVLSIDGYSPTKENIAAGRYPLFRPLYLVANKATSEKALDFINYVLSNDGQEIISSQGTVNLAQGKVLEPLWKNSGLPL